MSGWTIYAIGAVVTFFVCAAGTRKQVRKAVSSGKDPWAEACEGCWWSLAFIVLWPLFWFVAIFLGLTTGRMKPREGPKQP